MTLREYDFENTPTVSIVKNILTDAIKMKATDLHFDPTKEDLSIRFRISGELKEYTIAPDNVKTNIITRIKILAGMNINDTILPKVGTINFELDNNIHTMHVSSLPILDGEKIVVHISSYAQNLKKIENIGYTVKDINKIKNLLKEPQGIILVTGNANSGKTTTTYSILQELNNKSNNIISIENPVKMKIKGLNQVQIAPEKGLSYRAVLRNVMLQDPNVISIDDLVDDETARAALRASVSGRLVISTMHTKTAYGTIDTLLNMDVENYLLGSNLIGIISQRLVKRLCPACRELRSASSYEISVIKEILGESVTDLYYPNGCDECNNGYIDQIPIAEVVVVDEELRNAISNNKSRDLIRSIIDSNTESIIENGFRKVIKGKTSFEEMLRAVDLRVDFTKESKIRELILGNGISTDNKNVMSEENNKTTENSFTTKKEQEISAKDDNQNNIFSSSTFINSESENKEEENKNELNNNQTPATDVVNNIVIENNKLETTEDTIPNPTIPLSTEPGNVPINSEEEIKKEEITPSQTTITNETQDTETVDKENIIQTTTAPETPVKSSDTTNQSEITNSEVQNNEQQTETPITTTPTSTPINFDDDEDDDNFNYGDSYINNF